SAATARPPRTCLSWHDGPFFTLGIAFVLMLGLASECQLQAANGDLDDALVAHWAFNDLAGTTVRDSSTNGFDGTLTGGGWTNGIVLYDGAVQFDGVDDALFIPAAGTAPPAAIGDLDYGSICIRFRFSATGSSDIIPLFFYGEAQAGPHNSLILEIGHGGYLTDRRLYFTIVNAGFCFDSGANLLPDTWYHFVAVVGTNSNTGYLNGQELIGRRYNLSGCPSDTDFFSSVPIRECLAMGYGRYGAESRFFHGRAIISDVQIYRRPLTADEINQLYQDVSDTGVFRVDSQAAVAGSGQLVMTWPSDTNYTYSICHADTLLGGLWQPVTNLLNFPSTPPLNCCTVLVDSAVSGFYRVQAAPSKR
ncbi:MAG: hypothetical protein NTW03_13135, partial [Verrucomicrobia bacterium]|nr:hypothetical protein [Verrucomicrobiota bacterium]